LPSFCFASSFELMLPFFHRVSHFIVEYVIKAILLTICSAQRIGSAAGVARFLFDYMPFLANRACERAEQPLSDWSRCWAAK